MAINRGGWVQDYCGYRIVQMTVILPATMIRESHGSVGLPVLPVYCDIAKYATSEDEVEDLDRTR
jgi:hypothetical protein